jgi:hypothetical protein
LPGEPTDGTLTEYDQNGNVIGTENLAKVVITVTTTEGVASWEENRDATSLSPLEGQ